MQLQTLILLALLGCALVVAFLFGRLQGMKSTSVEGLPPNLLSIYSEIQGLPSKILATIQGSINPQKGKVAELLTYAELRHDYDTIIPLGQPFDFLGIKFNEKIDFIEVKSERSALSENERAISNLIQQGRIHFRLIVVKDTEATAVAKGLTHDVDEGNSRLKT
jgi:hypothetical protein